MHFSRYEKVYCGPFKASGAAESYLRMYSLRISDLLDVREGYSLARSLEVLPNIYTVS